jgi:hypothetical protein
MMRLAAPMKQPAHERSFAILSTAKQGSAQVLPHWLVFKDVQQLVADVLQLVSCCPSQWLWQVLLK